MKEIEELYVDLEVSKRKLLEEKTLSYSDLEKSEISGLNDKFLEAMRRKNEMRSWSTSRASTKSKKAELLDKRAVYVDLDEKNLLKLLFLSLKRGPTGLKEFLNRNKEITQNFTQKQLRRISELFDLDDDEIDTLCNCFSPNSRSQDQFDLLSDNTPDKNFDFDELTLTL
jgi:superfamily II DNA or RNA helicase